jgi:hypothetical protein
MVVDIFDCESPLPKSKVQSFCFKIILGERSWILGAESYEDGSRWLEALQSQHMIVKQREKNKLEN